MENEKDLNLESSDNEDFAPDLITLEDEDGISHDFEIAGAIEEGDDSYIALIPVYDDAAESLEDSGELIVLKTVVDGDEEYFEAIEDELEFNRISKKFMDKLKDEYDIVE